MIYYTHLRTLINASLSKLKVLKGLISYKKGRNEMSCDITFGLVKDLPLKSCGCYVLFGEVSTLPLYNVDITYGCCHNLPQAEDRRS